jgi:ABC-type multidrug transport system fused ATPase/permease subunit
MSSYFFILTFAPVTQTTYLFNVVHFTISIFAPIAGIVSDCDLLACYNGLIFSSKIRAAIISVNLFSLLCDGTNGTNDPSFASLGSITKFGGPILYLFVYMLVLFSILVWVDSGSLMLWRRTRPTSNGLVEEKKMQDVTNAATAVANSDDVLRVLNISKSYNGKRVLDDVSLGVPKDEVFALLGPNGAGKTTIFNIIRKFSGDVFFSLTNHLKVVTFYLMKGKYLSQAHPSSETHGKLVPILVFVRNSLRSTLNSPFANTL